MSMMSGRREGRRVGWCPTKNLGVLQRQYSSLFGRFEADQYKVCELQ